jgi:hypothetical protein
MRSVSTVVGLYLALIAMLAVGLALAGKLGEFSSYFNYAASRAGDVLSEEANQPFMTLALEGDDLYLNVTPLRAFSAKYLILEFANNTLTVRELGEVIYNTTLIPLVYNYSGEVFKPILVTGSGVAYVYTPGRDPLLASLDPGLAGKVYVDAEVVSALRSLALREVGALRQVYNPLLNKSVIVVAGLTQLNYTRVDAGLNLTLNFRIGQVFNYSTGELCPALFLDSPQGSITITLFCLSQQAGFFDKTVYYGRLNIGGYPVDLYVEAFGLYRGYAYYWYPQPSAGTIVPVSALYVALRFKPLGYYTVILKGSASLSLTVPGSLTIPFYSPYTNVCDTILDDYLGYPALTPVVLAPSSTFTANASFRGYVNATNIYGGFNQTRQYQFTNATLIGGPAPSYPGSYQPLYTAYAGGFFETSDYIVILAGGTYLLPQGLVNPSNQVQFNATITLDTAVFIQDPSLSIDVPEASIIQLGGLVDYSTPSLQARSWYSLLNYLTLSYLKPGAYAVLELGGSYSTTLNQGEPTVVYSPGRQLTLIEHLAGVAVETLWNTSCTGVNITPTVGAPFWFNITAYSLRLPTPGAPAPLTLSISNGTQADYIAQPHKPAVTVAYGGSVQEVFAYVYRGSNTTLVNNLNTSLRVVLVKLRAVGGNLVLDLGLNPVYTAIVNPGPNYITIPGSFEAGFYALIAQPLGEYSTPLPTEVTLLYVI